MTEEFNLSEKMHEEYLSDGEVINVEDVKEFIRLLKEELSHLLPHYKVRDERVNKILDKLAGEKLI